MDRRIFWRGALLFVLLLSFVIRVSGLTVQSMWRDEIDALRFSQMPLSVLAGYFTRPGWNGPLFYLLLRPWITVAGRTEFGLRYFSLWFGVLGVALIYRLAKIWFSKPVGVLAALLMAVSAYMVWYAQELKMYALFCALVLAVLLLYRRALQTGDWRTWTIVVALAWLTAGVHIMGSLLVLVMVGLVFIWWPRTRVQRRIALVGLSGMILPAVLAAPWALSLWLRGGDIGHEFMPLVAMIRTLLHAFSQGITGFWGLLPIVVTVFGALAGTMLWSHPSSSSARPDILPARAALPVSAGKTRSGQVSEWRYVLALWVWLVVPILGLYAISLRVPMFVDRYLIWIGPALYVLVARGLEQVWRRSNLLSVLYLALLLLFAVWGLWKQMAAPIKSDFRAAAAYLRQHRTADELVLFHISYVRSTFEFYYGDASPFADGIATDDNTDVLAVDAAMADRVAGHDTVWLVLSEPEMWDRRGMTMAWLDQHILVSRQDFARVSVSQYRLSAQPSLPDSP